MGTTTVDAAHKVVCRVGASMCLAPAKPTAPSHKVIAHCLIWRGLVLVQDRRVDGLDLEFQQFQFAVENLRHRILTRRLSYFCVIIPRSPKVSGNRLNFSVILSTILCCSMLSAVAARSEAAPPQGGSPAALPVIADIEKLSPALREAPARKYPLRIIVEFDDPAGRPRIAALQDEQRGKPARRHEFQRMLAAQYARVKQQMLPALQRKGLRLHRDFAHLPMSVVVVVVVVDSEEALASLLQNPLLARAYHDGRKYTKLTQSRPLVRLPEVENLGFDGAGVTVVVLDTGVDYTLNDFGNCTAPGTPAGCRVAVAGDLAPDDGQLDQNGHGTNVSAIVAGVAAGADLAVFDVFVGSSAFDSDIIAGIDWAIANQAAYNIAAINMSLGGTTKFTDPCTSTNPFFRPFRTPITNARNIGILSAVASGNETYTDGLTEPACVPEAVSVGAVYDANLGALNWSVCTDNSTSADRVTCFSNSADYLNMLAPGALINAGGFSFGGTSQATPHVAAAIAVLHQIYPGESADDIHARLVASGKPVTDPRNGLVFPRLDLWQATGAVNDDFETPYQLPPSATTLVVYTGDASKQTDEPDHAGETGGKSIWFSFMPLANTLVTLDTAGSDFDTVLAVYSGTEGAAIDELALLAANNDSGAAGGVSEVSFVALAGASYFIAADGVGGSGGRLRLNIINSPASPAEDGFDEDIPLPLWSLLLMSALLAALGYRFNWGYWRP